MAAAILLLTVPRTDAASAGEQVRELCGGLLIPNQTELSLGDLAIRYSLFTCVPDAGSGGFVTKFILFSVTRDEMPDGGFRSTLAPAPAATLVVPGRLADDDGTNAAHTFWVLGGTALFQVVQPGFGKRLFVLTARDGAPVIAPAPLPPGQAVSTGGFLWVYATADGGHYAYDLPDFRPLELTSRVATGRSTLARAIADRAVVYAGATPIPLGVPRSDALVAALIEEIPLLCKAPTVGATELRCQQRLDFKSDGKVLSSTVSVTVRWENDVIVEVIIGEFGEGPSLDGRLLRQSLSNTQAWWGDAAGHEEDEGADCGGSTATHTMNDRQLTVRWDACGGGDDTVESTYSFTLGAGLPRSGE